MLRSMSRELYIIWLSFMVQMCKMMVSPGIFFNFKILIFQVVRELKGKKWPNMTKISICRALCFRNHQIGRAGGRGGGVKRAKNDPKWQKILSASLRISGTIHHMIVILGTHFSKFWFLEFWGDKRAKIALKLPISVCSVLYFRNCRLCHQNFDNNIYRCFSLFFFLNAAL